MLAEQRQAAAEAAAAAGLPTPPLAPDAPAPSIADGAGHLHPSSPDVVEILAFSCIMLNTDAHNASIKKEKKMTRKQFVSNNRCEAVWDMRVHGPASASRAACLHRRGIDRGADLPRAFLEYLYDSIVTNEIRMNTKAPGAAAAAPPSTVSTLLLPNVAGACIT